MSLNFRELRKLLPKGDPREKGRRGPSYLYPWSKWLMGRPTTLRKGVDYHCKQSSMCVQVRVASARMNLRVSVYPKADGSILLVPRGSRGSRK